MQMRVVLLQPRYKIKSEAKRRQKRKPKTKATDVEAKAADTKAKATDTKATAAEAKAKATETRATAKRRRQTHKAEGDRHTKAAATETRGKATSTKAKATNTNHPLPSLEFAFRPPKRIPSICALAMMLHTPLKQFDPRTSSMPNAKAEPERERLEA